MTLQVVLDGRGLGSAEDALRLLAWRARDVSAAWPIVGEVFADAERRHFGSMGSGTWQPLAKITTDQKGPKRHDSHAMRASNALYHSLTEHYARGAVREYHEPTEMRFGTDLFYAKFHDQGEGVPKRPLMNADDRALRSAATTLAKYLATGKAPTHF